MIDLASTPLGEVANDAAFDVIVDEHFFEKIFDVVNLVGDEADDLLKSPMLLTRDLAVQNVVKQELRHHRRDHHVDLAPRQMHEHALQPPNLTRYVKLHAGGILIRRMGR